MDDLSAEAQPQSPPIKTQISEADQIILDAATEYLAYYKNIEKPQDTLRGIDDVPEHLLSPPAKEAAKNMLLDKITSSVFDPKLQHTDEDWRIKVESLGLSPEIAKEVTERVLALAQSKEKERLDAISITPPIALAQEFMKTYPTDSPDELRTTLENIPDQLLPRAAKAIALQLIAGKENEIKSRQEIRTQELIKKAPADAQQFLRHYQRESPEEILGFLDAIPEDNLSTHAKEKVREILSKNPQP